MGLSEYSRKRNFDRTPEPRPSRKAGAQTKAQTKTAKSKAVTARSAATPAKKTAKKTSGSRATASRAVKASVANAFVVHKHDASHLHYDLRLRVGKVLRCWAVPKGPSLDPREKRLAVETEDHPADYADFEGVIPQGEYGGGTMMIWDRGTWKCEEGDAATALRDGMLKFRLEGERLKGRWMLVRTKRAEPKPQWLLVKERDSEAAPGVHAETFATSVASGRTMAEIAAGAAPLPPAPTGPRSDVPKAKELPGARAAPMPATLKPQLAVAATAPPEGDDWVHEVKFDGYRLLAFCRGGSIRLLSRTGLDWTARLPDVAAAIEERIGVDAVLDGEAVILDPRGVSDFQALQNAIHTPRSKAIVFFAFDLPWCDGVDLTRAPLDERVRLLGSLVGPRQDGRLRLSEHIVGNGPAAFDRACRGGLEGIVSKRRSSPYAQARTPAWVKVKCFNKQEFVVVGFTPPEGSRARFGALLLAYHDDRKALRFAGKVGTGFSRETLDDVAQRLEPLRVGRPALADPPAGAEYRGVAWVRPALVAQVQFRDWTSDGSIRHTSFKGLRDDVDPVSVVREGARAESAAEPGPAADASAPAGRVKAAGRSRSGAAPAQPGAGGPVRLTHPDRIVYPDRGAGYALTKRQVVEYYQVVAERMLPGVAHRPLAVLRCPDGEGGKTFFQKHPAKGMPAAIRSIDLRGEDGQTEKHLMIEDADGLLALVQMNVLEIHPWGARAESPDTPDQLIFDLDPGPGVSWRQTVEGARMLREALSQVGLTGLARISGGKGIHIVVPIEPAQPWAAAKEFAKAVAETLVRLAPRRFIATATLAKRDGLIYIDYLRNARGATAIASYSTRNRPGAPVALPVGWDELSGFSGAGGASVPAVQRRIERGEPNPWPALDAVRGRLPQR